MRAARLALALLFAGAAAVSGEESPGPPRVALDTSEGTIMIELFPDQAPGTVENFLGYLDRGFYAGTIFHRVVPGRIIQGGGFTEGLEMKPSGAPIQNEADNGLSNDTGTIAMARWPDPHSATAQFYINTGDNVDLNHREKTPRGWGYAVFGRVVEGMDVVDAISAVPTTTDMRTRMQNVPVEPVVIVEARRLQPDKSGE